LKKHIKSTPIKGVTSTS